MTFFIASTSVRSYVGNDGFDFVDYSSFTGPISVDLTQGTVTHANGTVDHLISIEGIVGTPFDDTVKSYGGPPFFGTTVELLGGNNTFIWGGNTEDALQYGRAPRGVTVDLAAHYALNGYGGTDTLVGSINGVEPGSMFDDTLLGDDLRNSFRPSGGNDYVDGRGGPFNQVIFDGGRGDGRGVTVNLSQGYALDQFGGRDTLVNIQAVLGSNDNDTIIGDDGGNYLEGNTGSDFIDGRGGVDSMGYNSAVRGVYVNFIAGIALDGTGSMDHFTNMEGAGGTRFSDIMIAAPESTSIPTAATFVLNDGDDFVYLTAGNFAVVAGNGYDTVIYAGARGSFTIQANADHTTFVQKPDGRDFLVDVEAIQFSDGFLDVGSGVFTNAFRSTSSDFSSQVGTIGNDAFVFKNNRDQIYGGAGIDTVSIEGSQSSFSLSYIESASVITIGSAEHTLVDVERIQFSNGVLALDTQGNAGNAYRLYQAAFNRTPDTPGLSFWVHALDQGVDIQSVAAGFVNAAEFRSVYGTNPSNAHIVDLMYQNVLGRAGESAGINFWVGQLDGGLSVGALLQGFAVSSENHGIVDPKIALGIVLDTTAFLV